MELMVTRKDRCREKIKDAQKYFVKIVSEFIYNDEPVFVVNKKREIRLSGNTKIHIGKLNQDQKKWLKDVFDDELDIVVQDWIETRASYNEDLEHPSSQMKNFLAWQKVGILYLYIIDGKESYIDVVPHEHVESFVYWAKLATRFIDCRHYPRVKHYFNDETNERYTKSPNNKDILDDLEIAIGDYDEGSGFPRYVNYHNSIVTTKATIE